MFATRSVTADHTQQSRRWPLDCAAEGLTADRHLSGVGQLGQTAWRATCLVRHLFRQRLWSIHERVDRSVGHRQVQRPTLTAGDDRFEEGWTYEERRGQTRERSRSTIIQRKRKVSLKEIVLFDGTVERHLNIGRDWRRNPLLWRLWVWSGLGIAGIRTWLRTIWRIVKRKH